MVASTLPAIAPSTTELQRDQVWTDEAFAALPDRGQRYEIIKGVLCDVGNSGMEHGNLGMYLGGSLEIYSRSHQLGAVCDSSTAFSLASGSKRSSDVAFVAKARLRGMKRLPKGFFVGAPDLAVEILSPSNTVEEIHEKLVEYFENGCRLVWVVHPDERYVLVYRSLQPDRLLKLNDALDSEDLLPGFTLPLADLFAEWAFDD